MRRNMDLVRKILGLLAKSDGPLSTEKLVKLTSNEYSHDLVDYHLRIMDEGGLIVASIFSAGDDQYYSTNAERLTWAGNDFLDSVQDDTVWNKVKKSLVQVGGSASFKVIEGIAVKIALGLLEGALC